MPDNITELVGVGTIKNGVLTITNFPNPTVYETFIEPYIGSGLPFESFEDVISDKWFTKDNCLYWGNPLSCDLLLALNNYKIINTVEKIEPGAFIFLDSNQKVLIPAINNFRESKCEDYGGAADEITGRILEFEDGTITTRKGGFYQIKNFKTVIFPKSIKDIDRNIFNSLKLREIIVDKDNPYYESIDNKFLIKKATKKLIAATPDVTEIPKEIRNIGAYALRGCGSPKIDTLTILGDIDSVGDSAFYRSTYTKVIFKGKTPCLDKNIMSRAAIKELISGSIDIISPYTTTSGKRVFDGFLQCYFEGNYDKNVVKKYVAYISNLGDKIKPYFKKEPFLKFFKDNIQLIDKVTAEDMISVLESSRKHDENLIELLKNRISTIQKNNVDDLETQKLKDEELRKVKEDFCVEQDGDIYYIYEAKYASYDLVLPKNNKRFIVRDGFLKSDSHGTLTIPGTYKKFNIELACNTIFMFGLQKIIFEEGIEEIGVNSFNIPVDSIYFPNSLKLILDENNNEPTKLLHLHCSNIYIPEENQYYSSGSCNKAIINKANGNALYIDKINSLNEYAKHILAPDDKGFDIYSLAHDKYSRLERTAITIENNDGTVHIPNFIEKIDRQMIKINPKSFNTINVYIGKNLKDFDFVLYNSQYRCWIDHFEIHPENKNFSVEDEGRILIDNNTDSIVALCNGIVHITKYHNIAPKIGRYFKTVNYRICIDSSIPNVDKMIDELKPLFYDKNTICKI